VKPIPIVEHFTPEQIDHHYRTCADPREKTRWHVIWLLTRPGQRHSANSASAIVGLSPAWAAEILKRWNAHGPDGLRDGRRENGAKPLLNARQQQALLTALRRRAPDGGLWTSPKVAQYVQERWGHAIDPATGWKWLKRLGFSLQVPRPSHPHHATHDERRGWKKSPQTTGAGAP
jgi:transposase